MSEIRANLISDVPGTGPATLHKQSAAKMRVFITYSSGTPIPNEEFNVSSLVDVGTGIAGINLTSAMTNANYPAAAVAHFGARTTSIRNGFTTASYIESQTYLTSTGNEEDQNHSVIVHGDLA